MAQHLLLTTESWFKVDAFLAQSYAKLPSLYTVLWNFEKMSRILIYCFLCTIRKGVYTHKWCMHSILPLAPRVKQPAAHFHNAHKFTDTRTRSIMQPYQSVTPGCGTRPVSIGSRRRRTECAEHCGVISVFVHVRFAFGRGEPVRRLNVIRNCCKCCRTLCEPAVSICTGLFGETCVKNGEA